MKIEDAVKAAFESVPTGAALRMPELVVACLRALASDKTKFAVELTESGEEISVADRVRAFANTSDKYELRHGKGGGLFRAGEAPPKAEKRAANPLTNEQLEARIQKMQATLASRQSPAS